MWCYGCFQLNCYWRRDAKLAQWFVNSSYITLLAFHGNLRCQWLLSAPRATNSGLQGPATEQREAAHQRQPATARTRLRISRLPAGLGLAKRKITHKLQICRGDFPAVHDTSGQRRPRNALRHPSQWWLRSQSRTVLIFWNDQVPFPDIAAMRGLSGKSVL